MQMVVDLFHEAGGDCWGRQSRNGSLADKVPRGALPIGRQRAGLGRPNLEGARAYVLRTKFINWELGIVTLLF